MKGPPSIRVLDSVMVVCAVLTAIPTVMAHEWKVLAWIGITLVWVFIAHLRGQMAEDWKRAWLSLGRERLRRLQTPERREP